jgi:hypothetical protein
VKLHDLLVAPDDSAAGALMGFLSQDELVSLRNRLIRHFPSGELVFNSYTRFAIWVVGHRQGGVRYSPSERVGAEYTAINNLVEEAQEAVFDVVGVTR